MSIDVITPDGTADDEIEILEVAVAAGADVAAGDVLVEVATDKANVEVVAPAAGRVAEGDTVAGNTVLVVLEAA